MGIFSGTAKGSDPMTTGGSKNKQGSNSPQVNNGNAASSAANSATRALVGKFSKGKEAGRLSMKVAGNSGVKL